MSVLFLVFLMLQLYTTVMHISVSNSSVADDSSPACGDMPCKHCDPSNLW